MPTHSPWRPGTTILGEFVVERELGRGGFGEVVLAVSRRTGERYAVKRVLRDDPVEQGRFLTEAQRWISLPPHRHITPCHFTRTAGTELVVFSDYVPGGSLADWIADGRLYSGGPQEALHRVLRIAVEAAWGLDAAHAHGLLHLDTKPGNVLLTDEGQVRITDFGLAAGTEPDTEDVVGRELVIDALARPGSGIDEATSELLKSVFRQVLAEHPAGEAPSLRATADGATSAYASPEQAEGRSLGRAADLWSWAVTVLEMVTGARTWPSGTLAGAALDMFLHDGADGPIAVPDGLAELLRTCFRPEPQDRPRSLRAAAEALTRVAALECGITLDGEPPRPPARAKGGYERRLPGGASWQDPRTLLGEAYEAAGRDPRDAVRFWPSGLGSRASQAMEDLRALAEAARVLDAEASPQLLALVTAESGRVRQGLGDLPGAVQAYRRSAAILETDDSPDGRSLRLSVLHSLAIVLRHSGSPAESAAMCDQIIDAASTLDDPSEAAWFRSLAFGTKANAVDDPLERLPLIERTISELQAVDRAERRAEGLAMALANQAGALAQAGRRAEAEASWSRADELIGAAVSPGRSDLEAVRATLRLNRALIAMDPRDQAAHAQDAVSLYEPLVHERGRTDVAGDFGRALFLTGRGHEHAGRPQEALAAYRSARSVLEQVVLRDGRTEFTRDLAQAQDHEATLVRQGDPHDAVALARRSVDLWDRVSEADGRQSFVVQRAEARRKLAGSLVDAGESGEAARLFDEAEHLLESATGDDAVVVLALIGNGRAVLHRRSGAPDVACRVARAALDRLGRPRNPESRKAQVQCLRTLTAALGNLGEHEEALAVTTTIETAVASLVDEGEAPLHDLADARQRRANVLLRLGHTAEALDPASQALADYDRLIAEGRSDLVAEAARLRAATSMALQRIGDLDGAAHALETARRQIADHPDYRWHLLVDPRLAKVPELLGTDAHALVMEHFADRLAELEEVRGVERGHVQRLLAELAERRDRLLAGNMPAVHPDQLSQTLEDMCGSLIWLAAKHPADHVHEACARTALMLGVSSMSCDRAGAAQRGFQLAIDHGRVLVVDRRRTEHLEDWANAHLALASWRTTEGDDEGAARVVRDMEGHLPRAQAAAWSAHARQFLAGLKQPRG